MPAATKSEWTTFLKSVKLTVGVTDYTIKVWNLKLTVVPWTGIDSPAQQLADGRRRQKVRGWHVVVEFDAQYGWIEAEHKVAMNAISALAEGTTGVIDFDATDNPGDRTLTVVLKNADDFLQKTYDGRVQGRPFRVELITQDYFATGAIPSWIAGDPAP